MQNCTPTFVLFACLTYRIMPGCDCNGHRSLGKILKYMAEYKVLQQTLQCSQVLNVSPSGCTARVIQVKFVSYWSEHDKSLQSLCDFTVHSQVIEREAHK